jgi:hypothetical protein
MKRNQMIPGCILKYSIWNRVSQYPLKKLHFFCWENDAYWLTKWIQMEWDAAFRTNPNQPASESTSCSWSSHPQGPRVDCHMRACKRQRCWVVYLEQSWNWQFARTKIQFSFHNDNFSDLIATHLVRWKNKVIWIVVQLANPSA